MIFSPENNIVGKSIPGKHNILKGDFLMKGIYRINTFPAQAKMGICTETCLKIYHSMI